MHIPRAINRTEILQRLGQGFRQFGENTTLAIHLSLREAMKRKGGEVIYFVQKDGQFQWQWMMDKAEIRRFKEKLRMQGHEGTIDHGIQIKPRRRDSTLVFSSSIDLLEPALKARGIETVYLTRLDYGPVHDVIDVLEQRYREQQIALREAALRQREEQQAAERAALEAEITARDARGEDDNDGGERQAA
jgi:hypothetical protein